MVEVIYLKRRYNMGALMNVKWGEFKIESLFSIEKCKCSNVSLLKNGDTPYIGATNRNNGVVRHVEYCNKLVTKGNCIAFICDGEGSIGYSIYKFEDFIGSTTVKAGRMERLNRHIGLFITTIADRVRGKYNFGFKRTEDHLKKETILLPITSSGDPDYDFMEQYMRNVEIEKVRLFKKSISDRIANFSSPEKLTPLNDKKWSEFKIENLFVIEAGKSKGLNHLKPSKYGISYLGATNNNNGVLTTVDRVEGMIQRGNAIAFIRNGEGSMGYSVYKKEDFIATSDITVGYNDNLNPYVGMFITTIADKIRGKYNFGYKRSDGRLKKETLQLPVNEIGMPDYEYMEQYMRNIERNKLEKYLKHLEHTCIY